MNAIRHMANCTNNNRRLARFYRLIFDMEEVWKGMARNLTTRPIPEAGHLPHEEQPDLVNEALLEFLETWQG